MKELGRIGLEISSVRADNLELHTDDQKVRAKGEFLNQVSSSGTNTSTAFASTPANHQSHLESCQIINKTSLVETNRTTNDEEMKEAAENSNSTRSDCLAVVTHSELSYNYPDLVGQKKQSQIQSDHKDGQLRPLCEESLKMSGIKVPGDFPMIDDDECEENNSAGDKEKMPKEQTSARPDLVEAVLVKTENVMVEPIPPPNHISSTSSINHQPQIRTLKSALKKTNVVSSKKKGMRVSFHDTKVFYIDTEAEANAEPQLLTVHSLDLPLAPTDFRVFIPAYDFLPSGHVPTQTSSSSGGYTAGVDRSFTFEDAIVSLRSYAQEVNNGGDDDDESEGEDEEFVAFTEANKTTTELAVSQFDQSAPSTKDQAEKTATNENHPIGNVKEEVKPVCKDINYNEEKVADSELDEGAVRCLTEANLREHEMILMGQDSFIEVIETSTGSEKEPELEEPIPSSSSLPENVVTNEKTLSPPLKELMVDISTLTASNNVLLNGPHSRTNPANGDDWQVELSPLNSIPDSETESSTSSQDTIIMMTSEESERNENHIKQSQLNFDQVVKKEPTPTVVVKSRDVPEKSGSVGSQDSDETLKYDGTNPQLNIIRNIDMEGNLLQTKNSIYSATHASSSQSQSQRTSSQIRQLMERNAMRRNLMRYSNTKLKRSTPQINGGGGNEVVNDVPPIEKQRQWRSQDSLLDTIKKLTLEEMRINEEGEAENGHDINNRDGGYSPLTNGFKTHTSYQNYNTNESRGHSAANGTSNGNLSIQDIQSLFNGDRNAVGRDHTNKYSNNMPDNKLASNLESVPGDLRQWKIRSNQWQQVHNNMGIVNNQERHVSNGNYFRSSGSLDTLQHSSESKIDPQHPATSKPFLKNGTVARCATLKEQYNNKDFYRVSLSQNYSQSDDHLEATNDEANDQGRDEEWLEEANEVPDELSQFVQMDSGRTERLRKRYSYSDMDQYDNAVKLMSNRRSSVRGIKPRFGSTSEILKQMQNQLQPPPLANHRHSSSHMTWPYPNGTTNGYSNQPREAITKSASTLPALQEEIYGSTRSRMMVNSSPIYASASEIRAQMTRSSSQLPIANNAGRTPVLNNGIANNNIYKQPPPYQPPPSPSQRNNGMAPNVPLKIHTKDERGVPEGASSSPKVLTDSVRHYSSPPPSQSPTINNGEGFNQAKSQADSGVVYYVMQV